MKKFLLRTLNFFKYFIIIYFASSVLFVVLYKFVNPPVTPLMVIRIGEQFFTLEGMAREGVSRRHADQE